MCFPPDRRAVSVPLNPLLPFVIVKRPPDCANAWTRLPVGPKSLRMRAQDCPALKSRLRREPFVVPGMGINATGARLYQPDVRVVSRTRAPHPLL